MRARAGKAASGRWWARTGRPPRTGPPSAPGFSTPPTGGDHFVTQPQPVYRSSDAGAHFIPTQDNRTPNADNCPNGSRLAAADDTTADVGYVLWRTGYGPTSTVELWRTIDAGRNWQQVTTVP